jgi:hypothetical protein
MVGPGWCVIPESTVVFAMEITPNGIVNELRVTRIVLIY